MTAPAILKTILPTQSIQALKRFYRHRQRARIRRLPSMYEEMLEDILANHLGITQGDVVFVHSSVDQLNLGFPAFKVLKILRSIVGEKGTLVFPTYPRMFSDQFLASGKVFDVRRTPSYTGIISEFARRQSNSIRSLHPTKSVCAIGPKAEELTNSHQNSPYPYDACSPYFKLTETGGKIIGLGVTTQYMSFIYCVDDAMKEDFPVNTYQPTLYDASCIDYQGRTQIVKTYAHNRRVTGYHNVSRFIKKYVPDDVCKDAKIYGMHFYVAEAKQLFDLMISLAQKNITVYSKLVYKKNRR